MVQNRGVVVQWTGFGMLCFLVVCDIVDCRLLLVRVEIYHEIWFKGIEVRCSILIPTCCFLEDNFRIEDFYCSWVEIFLVHQYHKGFSESSYISRRLTEMEVNFVRAKLWFLFARRNWSMLHPLRSFPKLFPTKEPPFPQPQKQSNTNTNFSPPSSSSPNHLSRSKRKAF